jgi:sugar lactone lactonase YvrE
LGESPVWDDVAGALWWIDCASGWLHRFEPDGGVSAKWQLPGRPGSMALAGGGKCLLAMDRSIQLYDPTTLDVGELCVPLAGRGQERFNDGKCDPAGRFWVGSMHEDYRAPVGRLFRVAAGGFAALDDGYRVPNGLAWTPDGRTMLMSCSVADTTFAYDFDPDAGTVAGKRVWAAPKTAPGFPDGAAMDADGCLWSARWDGGCVARLTPAGKLDRTVGLPCRRVTSCCFGGPRLDILYVTTARIGLDDGALAAQPLAGGLFAVDPGVSGVPVARFRR